MKKFLLELFRMFIDRRNFKKLIPVLLKKEINNPEALIDENNVVIKKLLFEAKNLKLKEEVVITALTKLRAEYMQDFLDKRSADKMITDDEYNEILKESSRLSLNLSIENLEEYREYWRIASGKLTPIEVDISLPKGEVCYFKSSVIWYEYRKMIKRLNYGGVIGRVKIVKGVNLRFGSIIPKPISADEIVPIDQGRVYFTNRKVVFMGKLGNKTIPLSNILEIIEYSDGVSIQKSTGKSPFIQMHNAHKANLILSSLIR